MTGMLKCQLSLIHSCVDVHPCVIKEGSALEETETEKLWRLHSSKLLTAVARLQLGL